VTNDDEEARDAPPAVPNWEPSELARQIANGHARSEHFGEPETVDLARLIQNAIDRGERKTSHGRTMYWDELEGIIVIVNPVDPDGGTAFRSDREYFEDWGRR